MDFEVGAETTRALRELGREEGATMFATLLAGFLSFVGRCAGVEDLVVGTTVSIRDRREI